MDGGVDTPIGSIMISRPSGAASNSRSPGSVSSCAKPPSKRMRGGSTRSPDVSLRIRADINFPAFSNRISLPSLDQTGSCPPSEETRTGAPAPGNGRAQISKRPVPSDEYATHFPSGEKALACSLNGVGNHGRAFRSARSSIQMSSFFLNNTYLPSGEKVSGTSGPSPDDIKRSGSRTLPSAGMEYMYPPM